MEYYEPVKPKHAMTFQAGATGVALALLAFVGRAEAAYANGVYLLIAGALYGSYELPRLEIERNDVFRQMLKWSEYDATAGMGRLTVAVNPDTAEGVITLANGFLSRAKSHFPLNWSFAGYLAGTLHELLERPTTVEIVDPTTDAAEMAIFHVTPEERHRDRPPIRKPVDPRTVARLPVWVRRLKTPVPSELE